MNFEDFKAILFMHGQDAIEDFLGYSINPNEDKDVTDNRLDEAYAQMPEDEYNKFVRAYAE